ncbi:hypothetical protein AZH51_08700 [Branchiibius sp. NY16-3462-2]|nr:hypothetical protein AZH51_08700 [Branchiibius sp. NY16-3462-2]
MIRVTLVEGWSQVVRLRVISMLIALVAVVFGSSLIAPTKATAAPAPGWYLALGDSLAAGYQPGQGDDKTGGYVGQVAAKVGAPLTNLACSGETTASYLGTTANRCFPGSSQDAAALKFLAGKKGTPGVITVDIGANDVAGCAEAGGVDLACVSAGLGTVKNNTVTILNNLRAAAPDSQIIVLNYYNPFLVFYLNESTRPLATVSASLQQQLNGSIAAAAKGANADVADVADRFQSDDFTTTVAAPPYGTLPVNVARICTWTWMCAKTDIHANDTGYDQLAAVTIAQLWAVTTPTTTATSTTSSATAPSSSVTGPPVVTDQVSAGHNAVLPIALGVLGLLILGLLSGASWRYLRD